MTLQRRFEGRVALVTGGNSGIGFATAQRLAREGAAVVITGRDERTLANAGEAIGANALVVRADVSRLSDLDALYERIRERHGRLDVVFANAGIASFFPAEAASEEDYDALMDVNVRGIYFTLQKALPLLAERSSIVINGSAAANKAAPSATVYAATKAALRSFARTFAVELLPRQGRVNLVSPGPIETPIFSRTGGLPEEHVATLRSTFTSLVPMSRFGTAEEVANVVAFLASDEASYVTGADVPVDGGLSTF